MAETYVVAIQAPNGKYVHARWGGGGAGDIAAESDSIGANEMFVIQRIPGTLKVTIRSYRKGMYWSLNEGYIPGAYGQIDCNQLVAGDLQEFTFAGQIVSGEVFSLIIHGYAVWAEFDEDVFWGPTQYWAPPYFTLTILAQVSDDWAPEPPSHEIPEEPVPDAT